MGQINTGVLKDFNDGEYVHGNDLDQVFEIIRTAINDNYTKLVDRYTKAEVDGLLYNGGIGVASSIAVATTLPAPTIQGKFLLKSPENVAYYCTGAAWIQITTDGDLSAVQTTLNNTITTHTGNTSNPHAVTAAQIGAVPLSQKGAVNGVASLNSSGQVPHTATNSLAVDGQRVGKMTVGDTQLYQYSGSVNTSSNSYAKMLSGKLPHGGSYRVKFNLNKYASSGSGAYGQLYVNGVARGIERYTSSTTPQTFTEDILNLNPGDTIEVWGKTPDTYMATIGYLTVSAALTDYVPFILQ